MGTSQVLWALLAIGGVQAVTSLLVLGVGQREVALLRWLPYLVSGAAGVLLATACLDLLPDAVRASRASMAVWDVLLLTILLLFCVQAAAGNMTDSPTETAVPEFQVHVHEHHHHHGLSSRRAGPGSLLFGSALHSAVDGVAIAAAFAAGPRPGWTAALAVGLHELPHRLGDFALLLHMGLPRRRAAELAIGAGAAALLGGLAAAGLGHFALGGTRWLLPVSAGSFLYIALVDLMPELHANRGGDRVWWQMACLGAGAAAMAALAHLWTD